ncbi:MAG: helix-turn-helix transcriptional regulator [Steroidobacteraceae bacterium]
MSTAKTTSGVVSTSSFHAANVRVSPRVNEKLPALDQILSAHDVARLTRRDRWVLYALSFLGRFPRKQRFRGHAIGWDRVEILEWLTPPKPTQPKASTSGTTNRHPRPNHACLWRGPSSSCRIRRSRRRHRSMCGDVHDFRSCN